MMADGMFGGSASGCRVFCWVGVQRAHLTMVVPMTPAEKSPRSPRLVSAATLGRGRAIEWGLQFGRVSPSDWVHAYVARYLGP